MPYDGRLLAGISVLMAVVEARTMVRAGEALGLSPSGVGRAIQRLEARVGVRLLERTTRSLALTEEGRRFYERARPLLDSLEEAAIDAAGSASRVRGRLRVNVDAFFARTVLARTIARFLDRYPDVSVDLIMRDAVGDLVGDGFDLALRFGDPPAGAALVSRKITETRVVTVAAPSYVAAHGRPAHPRDVSNHAAIDFWDVANRRPYDWEFRKGRTVLPVAVRARLMTSDSGTLLDACEAGAGIAQVLELGTRDAIASGRLIDLFPDWPDERFPLHAYYPSRHQPAKVRAFLSFVGDLLVPPSP